MFRIDMFFIEKRVTVLNPLIVDNYSILFLILVPVLAEQAASSLLTLC